MCKGVKNHPDVVSDETFTGTVYNLQFLEGVTQGVFLSDIYCSVLGHGIISKDEDNVLGHPFFGDWKIIDESLKNCREDKFGRRIVDEFTRDPDTNLVNGFKSFIHI
jgi:hypothetical protein